MARVTVEDCIEKIPNRYELVAMAARRAKNISAGAALTLPRDNDKDAVIALREIAEGTIDLDQLQDEVVQGFQRKQLIESLAKTGGEVMAEGDAHKQEIDAVFAEEQGTTAQPDNKSLDDAGMSFAGEDVDAED